MFDGCGDGELLDVARDAQRGVRVDSARQVLAVGRFAQRRVAAAQEGQQFWAVDEWDCIAAEIAAELGVGRGKAASVMQLGITLLERLPRVAEVFAAGVVEGRVITQIAHRTLLITDPEVLARPMGAWPAKRPAGITSQTARWPG